MCCIIVPHCSVVRFFPKSCSHCALVLSKMLQEEVWVNLCNSDTVPWFFMISFSLLSVSTSEASDIPFVTYFFRIDLICRYCKKTVSLSANMFLNTGNYYFILLSNLTKILVKTHCTYVSIFLYLHLHYCLVLFTCTFTRFYVVLLYFMSCKYADAAEISLYTVQCKEFQFWFYTF